MLDNEVKIAAAGGIESILNAMKQHAQHMNQCKKMGVLHFATLLLMLTRTRVKIAAAGGIESILNAMKQHAQHESVQEQWVWCTLNSCVCQC